MARPQVKKAKQALRSSGITLNYLAKTTGTTRGEVKQVFRQTARKMAKGGVTTSDTKAVRKALSGGPAAGVAATPAQREKATSMVVAARRTYKSSTGAHSASAKVDSASMHKGAKGGYKG